MPQSLKTHRIRYFYYEPTSINYMAYDRFERKIALLRRPIRKYKPIQNDQSMVIDHIEIWNFRQKAAFLEQTIYEDPNQCNLLEGLAWGAFGRLFSCGLNSYLNEYDLVNGRIKKSYCVNSDPAWCLAISPNADMIAVGTEKGFICLFKIYPDCLQYEKVMPKHENRVLCIEWYQSFCATGGDPSLFIVSGSIDFIKIFNYQSGRCVDFIKVGNNNVVVWCLKVLKDFTIVSGDSQGRTSFWNGKTTTLIKSYSAHNADVLALCVSEDEKYVSSAGVDPTIIQFNRSFEPNDTWIISWKRRPHSHDVRSLQIETPWLISGGVDTYLSFISTNSSNHVSHLTNLSHKVAYASFQDNNYVGFMYEKSIQIWKLGTSDTDQNLLQTKQHRSPNPTGPSVHVTNLSLNQNTLKLLDINSRKPIIAFDLNHEWLVYANYDNLKVIRWSEDKIEKIKFLHDPIVNISNIHIVDQNRLIISHGRTFETFKLDEFGVVLENSNIVNLAQHQDSTRIHKILSTPTKLIIMTSDVKNTVSIYDLTGEEMVLMKSFTNSSLPCAIQVNHLFESNEKLWLSFANGILVEYDLDTLAHCKVYSLNNFKSTNDDKESENEIRKKNEHWPIKQIGFVSEKSILISDDNNLYALDLDKDRITKCDKYNHIISMKNIKHNELAIVEITRRMIFTTLPPMLKTKKFGI